MSRSKKHHIVPQCYLRRFSADGRSLWTYDKPQTKCFMASVADVAQERSFYDVPEGKLPPPLGQQAIEETLSLIDSEYCNTLTALLDVVEREGINRDFQGKMAFFVAHQFMRTPEYRRFVTYVAAGTLKQMVHEQARALNPDLKETDYSIEVKDEYHSLFHGWMMLDEEYFATLADVFWKCIWLVGTNDTDSPLWTSDRPVVKYHHVPMPQRGGFGFAWPGVEVNLPLSPRHLLMLYEPTFFFRMREHDGRAVPLTLENIEHYNSLQVLSSDRQVYSPTADFELATKVCANLPRITRSRNR